MLPLAFAALLASLPPAHAAVPPAKAAKAARLANKAQAVADGGALVKAFKLSERALRKDPDNVRAHFVRGMAFYRVAAAQGGDPDLTERATQLFWQHITRVAELDPKGELGAIARSTLAELTATELIPRTDPVCSPEATQVFAQAEQRFADHDFSGAAELYLQASEACPENATYRAWLGDAHFALGDYRTARVHFEKAVSIEPCHALAQRYLADTLLKMGEGREAWLALTTAVTCDPGYEPARNWLDGLVSELYGFPAQLQRVRAPVEVAPDGDFVVTANMGEGDPAFPPALAMIYASAFAGQTPGTQGAETPLERTRAAVTTTLEVVAEMPAEERPGALFWARMMASAEHGCLDAGIYAFLIEPPLVPEFLEAREADLDGLVTCMRDVLAPIPGEGLLKD